MNVHAYSSNWIDLRGDKRPFHDVGHVARLRMEYRKIDIRLFNIKDRYYEALL